MAQSLLLEEFGSVPSAGRRTHRPGDPASIIASNDQLVRLGWKPELHDLSVIVQHALAWEKSCVIRV
jgi:UDP-glucose 4-epimerase